MISSNIAAASASKRQQTPRSCFCNVSMRRLFFFFWFCFGFFFWLIQKATHSMSSIWGAFEVLLQYISLCLCNQIVVWAVLLLYPSARLHVMHIMSLTTNIVLHHSSLHCNRLYLGYIIRLEQRAARARLVLVFVSLFFVHLNRILHLINLPLSVVFIQNVCLHDDKTKQKMRIFFTWSHHSPSWLGLSPLYPFSPCRQESYVF